MERNLTTGSVWRTVVSFSLPYLLSYFLQTLYGMADLFIIGRFNGVESTTAVSIGSQVMHMLTVIIVGLAMGSTVLIGQAVGLLTIYHKRHIFPAVVGGRHCGGDVHPRRRRAGDPGLSDGVFCGHPLYHGL